MSVRVPMRHPGVSSTGWAPSRKRPGRQRRAEGRIGSAAHVVELQKSVTEFKLKFGNASEAKAEAERRWADERTKLEASATAAKRERAEAVAELEALKESEAAAVKVRAAAAGAGSEVEGALRAEVKRVTEERAEAHKRLAGTENDLRESQERASKLEARATSAEDRLSARDSELAAAKVRMNELQMEVAQLKGSGGGKVKHLEEKLAALETRARAADERAARSDAELSKVKQQLAGATDAAAKATEQASKAVNEASAKGSREASEAKALAVKLEAELATVQKTLSATQAERDSLKASASSAASAASTASAASDKERELLREQLAAAKDEMKRMQERHAKQSRVMAQLEEFKADVVAKRAEKRETLNNMRASMAMAGPGSSLSIAQLHRMSRASPRSSMAGGAGAGVGAGLKKPGPGASEKEIIAYRQARKSIVSQARQSRMEGGNNLIDRMSVMLQGVGDLAKEIAESDAVLKEMSEAAAELEKDGVAKGKVMTDSSKFMEKLGVAMTNLLKRSEMISKVGTA